jgi:thiosulfate dehydrogenase (quinone) large subunit
MTSLSPAMTTPLGTGGLEGRAAGASVAAMRVIVGVTFLHEAAWKRPPDFGRAREVGLWEWSNFAVEYPVFLPYSWFVEQVVQPNFIFFGWSVFFLEAALGGFLILGLFTRAMAVVGLVQTLAITFSVLNQPVFSEWNYAYYLMIGAHLGILGTAAGRTYGIDAALRPLWERSTGRLAPLLLRAS